MARRKSHDGQLGLPLPETEGMNPNYLPPLNVVDDRTPESIAAEEAAADTHMPGWRESAYGASGKPTLPRRTLKQEINVRAGKFTGAKPEYHPELDGPLDSVYGAGGAPPSEPPAPPIPDEPEDDGEPPLDEGTGLGLPQVQWGDDGPDEYESTVGEVGYYNMNIPPHAQVSVERRGQPRPNQPGTSLAAHESVKKNGQYERIWEYLMARGAEGATSDEVDAIEQPGATVAASRRFSEMRRLGMIRRTAETRPTRAKRKAFVHVAVPRDQWVPLYPEPADQYIRIPAREIENHNNCRLALAKMMAAYGNCAIPGALMPLAPKPEAPEGTPAGISEHDICQVAMFQAWLLGCKALGIALKPNREGA